MTSITWQQAVVLVVALIGVYVLAYTGKEQLAASMSFLGMLWALFQEKPK
jgi:energy-coupling factor transporter transmembrane protein EcfT